MLVGIMNYWLVKSEPEEYGWKHLERDGRTAWTGVRNFQARNNLRSMQIGDLVLFYHSVSEKQIVGVALVEKQAYADPTAKEGTWVCVDLVPVEKLNQPVSLELLKKDAVLREMALLKQSRLSVTPVTAKQFERRLKLARTAVR